MRRKLILPTLFLATACIILSPSAKAQETEEYWNEVSRTVKEGDFEGYSALYHEDAVLVNGLSGDTYSVSKALSGWKQGFEDTKAGKMTASVDFRFFQEMVDETTAHETGIFFYQSQKEGGEPESVYIYFEALLIKKQGKWKMLMEYQKYQATPGEWEALE